MRAVSALHSAAVAALLLMSCGQDAPPASPERQPTQLTAAARKGDVPIVRGSDGVRPSKPVTSGDHPEWTPSTSRGQSSGSTEEPTSSPALLVSESPLGNEPDVPEAASGVATSETIDTALSLIDPSIARTPEEASIQAAAHPELLAEEQFSVSNTSCGSSLELPSLTEDALVLAVSDTFEDVYVEKGTARLDAIWWSDDSYAEWSYIYKAAGDAADLLPVQAMPEIDLSHPWRWINVRRGQYLVYGECRPTRPPVIGELQLIVPVINGTKSGQRVIRRWDGLQEIVYGAAHKFQWQDNRWKLDWRYWCLAVGEAQGDNGVHLFEATAEEQSGVVFRCEE